ncbi:transposase DNA-binding-containing protein [Sphingopyxis sp. BSNA05]|uniref:IS4/Tn5 family transposase DNA-binding protein n=1 Tax=Sphingopyxis sp. BSNA05 TaxID=1236614 RepID=UPI001C27725D
MRWADGEVDIGAFRDKRLGERLRTMLAQMAGAIGAPIPMACQDWANTKAAYRFLSNGSVNEGEILAGHFQATRARVGTLEGPILVLQDTTEFSYQRRAPEKSVQSAWHPADAMKMAGCDFIRSVACSCILALRSRPRDCRWV